MLAKRRLGRTELDVTILTLGAIPFVDAENKVSDAIINHALDSGVNFLETSHHYSKGKSEKKFGRVLAKRRDECVLHSRAIVKTKEEMAECIEKSLRNFRTDMIDIYGVHDVNCEVDRPEGFLGPQIEALEEARDKGRIRFLAVSGHRQQELIAAMRTGAFDVVMVAVNPLDLDIAGAVLPVASELDMGVIAMKPFAGGLFAERPDISLRFALSRDLSTVSVGVKNVDELKRDIAIAEGFRLLSDDEHKALLDEAAEVTKELGKKVCRRCGYCLREPGCPEGIDIPSVLNLFRHAKRYWSPKWAKGEYAKLEVKAGACAECGDCEERCPYQLPIREMLKEAHDYLKD